MHARTRPRAPAHTHPHTHTYISINFLLHLLHLLQIAKNPWFHKAYIVVAKFVYCYICYMLAKAKQNR